jgi:hypothetical protein
VYDSHDHFGTFVREHGGGGKNMERGGAPISKCLDDRIDCFLSSCISSAATAFYTVRYSIASFILRHNAVRLAKHKKNISIASLRATAPFSNKLLFKKSIRIVSGGDFTSRKEGSVERADDVLAVLPQVLKEDLKDTFSFPSSSHVVVSWFTG